MYYPRVVWVGLDLRVQSRLRSTVTVMLTPRDCGIRVPTEWESTEASR